MSSTRTEKPLKTIVQSNSAMAYSEPPIQAATVPSRLPKGRIRLEWLVTINGG